MSDILIRRSHTLSVADARSAAEKIAKQLQKDFDLDYEWDGNVLRFQRTGVDGELHVTSKEVRLEARLGMLLAFLRPRIEAEVHQILDKLLAAPKHPAHAKKKPRKSGS
jgi:putative polyhydroxyalkanoate system protein